MIGRFTWIALGLTLVSATLPAAAAVSVKDDTGSRVELARPARRIVSLTPGTTEMLFAVGAAPALVGVSAADNYPPAARALPKIGSYSGPDLERIVAARPDLVVAAYGNPLDLIALLRRRHLPVYVCNPSTVAGVLRDMLDLGSLSGQQPMAQRVVRGLEARLKAVERRIARQRPVKTLVVIWDEPLTVAGGRSFIQDILRRAGGINAAASITEAYPKLDPERLVVMDPDVVLFPVEPAGNALARLKRRPGFRQSRALRTRRVYVVNPDWLERPGPRVVQGVEAVARLLHPVSSTDRASK